MTWPSYSPKMFEFIRTDTQMAGIDATALEFMVASTAVCRVPKVVCIYKPAGVAYTIAAGARLEIRDKETAPNILFSIPADGFLDQTTAQSRVVLPSEGAYRVVNSGLTLWATGAITAAAGTQPDVNFRLFYDEYEVAW